MNRPRQLDAAGQRARLESGEWLLPGEVAILFGLTRWAVNNWIKAGKIGVRLTPSGQRMCDPVDVGRLLAEYEQVRKPPADPARGA